MKTALSHPEIELESCSSGVSVVLFLKLSSFTRIIFFMVF